ncbi:unnamed protein product [Effrenium voratum]|uniref:Uncharacterized protein n=1 Tax=Effrenium voratum TaxID=2562239 RepID=A0AA36I8E8_9DINO|nr:unnamed protein product [Effrenium voratum]
METASARARSEATGWRKKPAFTKRYLDTVWPRSYWSGPRSRSRSAFCHYKPSQSASPTAGKPQAWAPEERSKKAREKPTLVPQEKAEMRPGANMFLQEKRPSSFYANLPSTEEMLMRDKRRQEVFMKMAQVGSLKLVMAQVEVTSGYQFADAKDFMKL